jgi:N-acyl-D-amino-acid deacylase
MTGLPAARFGLAGRGRIAAGCAADLVVFDAARIADRASYDDPLAAPAGIDAVLVNGRVAVAHGVLMDAHAGMVLRRG